MSKTDSSDHGTLKPGQIIRPNITLATANTLVKNLYGLTVLSIKELNSYDDKNYYILVDDTYDNRNIENIWQHGYVLKILNSLDSEREELIDGQNSMMQYLGQRGVCCSQPVCTKDGQLKVFHKLTIENKDDPDWSENNDGIATSSYHIIRLLTFIPGILLNNVPITEFLLYNGGKYVALLHAELKEFSHPGFQGEEDRKIWNLKQVPDLTKFLHVIKDPLRLELLNSVIKDFTTKVLINYDKLPQGYIHGDLNEQNLLVEKVHSNLPSQFDHMIHGLLDFGDAHCEAYIFDLAIFICYMMLETKEVEPELVGGHVLAGYQTQRSLSTLEISLLRICIASRMAQSLIMGAYSYSMDPGNEYLLYTAKTGWKVLEKFWSMSEEDLSKIWEGIIKKYLKS